jgi:hypothetical protein
MTRPTKRAIRAMIRQVELRIIEQRNAMDAGLRDGVRMQCLITEKKDLMKLLGHETGKGNP